MTNSEIKFPKKAFIANLIFTLCIIFWFVFFYIKITTASSHAINNYANTKGLLWQVIYNDEVLTMSSMVYISTGNVAWKERYYSHEKILQKNLEDLSTILNNKDLIKEVNSTSKANNALIEMEKMAFSYIEQNYEEKANKILSSDKYLKQKDIYSQHMVFLEDKVLKDLDDEIKKTNKIYFYGLVIACILEILSLMLWVIVSKYIHVWRKNLKNLNKDLESSNEELENYAHICSHALKEPIRNISNSILFISKLNPRLLKDKESSQYVGYIKEASLKMSNMVDAILNYSRIDGKIKGNRSKVMDLKKIIQGVISFLNYNSKEVEFKLHNIPKIQLEKHKMEHIFQNLFQNSYKFKKKNQKLLIDISCQEEDGVYRITVEDNGQGVDKNEIKKIFQIFVKGKDSSGTGMGLYLCKKIVNSSNGDIWCEPIKSGAKFIFTIPKSDLDADNSNIKMI